MTGLLEQFDLDALRGRVASDEGAPEFPALAEALRRAGSLEEARQIVEAGLASAPSRLAGQVALALIRMDMDQLDGAEVALRSVLDGLLEPYRLDTEPEAALAPVEEDELSSDEGPALQNNLASALDASDPLAGFSTQGLADFNDHEIDDAIAAAESQPDQMHSPNTMAQRVLDVEAPFDAEGATAGNDAHPTNAPGDEFSVTASKPFSTHTMAGLLDRQGDHSGAQSIRESIDASRSEGAPVEPLDAAEAPEAITPAAVGDTGSAGKQRIVATLEQWLHNLQRGQQ